jgi:hypothetical protein
MLALGAVSQQDDDPVRPKGVVAFSIGERAAQFAPTFAKQYRGDILGRNIASAQIGDRTRPCSFYGQVP